MNWHRLLTCFVLMLFSPTAQGQGTPVPALLESGWGYVDSQTRKVVIPARFERAGRFVQGRASVRLDGRYGYVDSRGEFVIPPEYELARSFSAGLAAVSKDGKFGFINLEGKLVIECRYEWAGDLHDDRALVMLNERYGYIDRKGEMSIEPRFARARPFSGGFAAVAMEADQYYYIDTSGRRTGEATYAAAGEFNEGLARIRTLNGLVGYVDTTGIMVIDSRFDGAGDFRREMAAVRVGAKSGFIDRRGEYLSNLEFDEAYVLLDGVRVRKGVLWGTGRRDETGKLNVNMADATVPPSAEVEFASEPMNAAIYKPPMLEFDLEPKTDKSRLIDDKYRVAGGDTNVSDILSTQEEFMILFLLPGKKMEPRPCRPGVDKRIFAKFP